VRGYKETDRVIPTSNAGEADEVMGYSGLVPVVTEAAQLGSVL
jgi:hypothetical protein